MGNVWAPEGFVEDDGSDIGCAALDVTACERSYECVARLAETSAGSEYVEKQGTRIEIEVSRCTGRVIYFSLSLP